MVYGGLPPYWRLVVMVWLVVCQWICGLDVAIILAATGAANITFSNDLIDIQSPTLR